MKLKYKRHLTTLDVNKSYYFRDGDHKKVLGITDKLLIAQIHALILCGADSARDLLFMDPVDLDLNKSFMISVDKVSLKPKLSKKQATSQLKDFITLLKDDVVFFQFYIDAWPHVDPTTFTPVVSVISPVSKGSKPYFKWVQNNLSHMLDIHYK